MPKFTVKWNYKSSLGGPWIEGDVVDIDDPAVAEAINRDSPGVLAEGEVKISKKKDRQVKSAKSRKTKEEAITEETFGAVKDKRSPGKADQERQI